MHKAICNDEVMLVRDKKSELVAVLVKERTWSKLLEVNSEGKTESSEHQVDESPTEDQRKETSERVEPTVEQDRAIQKIVEAVREDLIFIHRNSSTIIEDLHRDIGADISQVSPGDMLLVSPLGMKLMGFTEGMPCDREDEVREVLRTLTGCRLG